MDWNLAIERNRAALQRIVAMLVAMAGLGRPSLLPLWEKVSPSSEHGEDEIRRRMRGAGRIADVSDSSSTPHPTSPSFHSGSATFSHKGRREGAIPTLPRRLHSAILRLLRPAESAARRLIVVAARGLVVAPSPPRAGRPRPRPASIFVRDGVGTGIVIPRGVVMPPGVRPSPLTPPQLLRPWAEGGAYASDTPSPLWGGVRGGGSATDRPPSFRLLDPLSPPFRRRRPVQTSIPRISFPGYTTPFPVAVRRPPSADDALDATRLTLRLRALASALDDIPRQARRFARWRATNDAARAQGELGGQFTFSPRKGADASTPAQAEKSKLSPARRRFRRFSPLRPGRPPGSRRRPTHEVHELLTELHGLAFEVLEKPDTS